MHKCDPLPLKIKHEVRGHTHFRLYFVDITLCIYNNPSGVYCK
jgi:hypothetical protein